MLITPKKSLGQNFLINRGVVEKIITATELKKEDVILEIGPGTGTLTQELNSKVKKIIVVEKDQRLIKELKTKFPEIEVIDGDILKFDPIHWELEPGKYKVIGNIPYYLTSHLLRTIFEKWPSPVSIIFMVQKEVAQRIFARPPHMNLLALSVQFYSVPRVIAQVSRGSFRPMPKVDSTVLQFVPKKTKPDPKFFNLIRVGFSSKRKTLINNLIKKMGYSRSKLEDILKELKLPLTIRAEALSIADWQKLQETLEKPQGS